MASLYTSTTRVKAHLGIPAATTYSDARVGYCVDAVDAVIADVIGLDIVSGLSTLTSYTETLDNEDGTAQEVLLAHYPVGSIAAVTAGGSALVEGTDFYQVPGRPGLLRLIDASRLFPSGRQVVQVTYTAGYASLPAGLQLAGDAIAAWIFNQLPKAGFGSEDRGEYAYQAQATGKGMTEADLPPVVRRMLAQYRRL